MFCNNLTPIFCLLYFDIGTTLVVFVWNILNVVPRFVLDVDGKISHNDVISVSDQISRQNLATDADTKAQSPLHPRVTRDKLITGVCR